jgi:predicted ATPase
MEKVSEIIGRGAIMPESKPKSKCSLVCIVCKSDVEVDDTLYFNNYNKETICSSDCFFIDKKKRDGEYFLEKIKGIPIKFREFEADEQLIKDNYGVNLFITGKSGSGKTVLASCIAKECIKNRIEFQWISFPSFLMELQNLYNKNKDSDTPFELAEKISNFNGVLIIDDIGAEKITDWVRQITYYIFNEREQRNLPIIITSNFSLEEVAQQVDVRISSRIAGMCKSIKLNGKDRRIDSQDKKWKKGEPKIISSKHRLL